MNNLRLTQKIYMNLDSLLLVGLIIFSILFVVLIFIMSRKAPSINYEKINLLISEENERNRKELQNSISDLRTELTAYFNSFRQEIEKKLSDLERNQKEDHSSNQEVFNNLNDKNIKNINEFRTEILTLLSEKLEYMRHSQNEANKQNQLEISELKSVNLTQLEKVHCTLENKLSQIQKEFFENMKSMLETNEINAQDTRSELSKLTETNTQKINSVKETIDTSLKDIQEYNRKHSQSVREEISNFSKDSNDKLEKLRESVEHKLSQIQKENNEKLEQMRNTVDEKLHSTLQNRLSESFKLVTDKLEAVHKGLGEMQNLASGVGDLKKVLSNVKTRGTLGEVLLGQLLEEILTIEQFEKNKATKRNSSEKVEFAIKLPGSSLNSDLPVWLPIDCKFPQEDYQRLVSAQDNADLTQIKESKRALERQIKKMAEDIRTKYIEPPNTTDFAILYLPTEGLYAEVLNINGLFESVQRDSKVIISGPTVLAALLNSLRIGFSTLAIQKSSSKIWSVLSDVRTQFSKFGESLGAVQKKLEDASRSLDKASKQSQKVEKALNEMGNSPPSNIIEDHQSSILTLDDSGQ